MSLGQGGKLAVSASIGHAAFPLTPHGLRPGWEQALSLTDMALYSAKNQGRKRAIGITAVAAGDAAALRSIEADFEQALQQGRVTTRTLLQRAPETAESA